MAGIQNIYGTAPGQARHTIRTIKATGVFLLVSGWVIVLAAVALLAARRCAGRIRAGRRRWWKSSGGAIVSGARERARGAAVSRAARSLLLRALRRSRALALMGAGLCRSRNAAHAMVAALCAVAVAALAWFATGFAWQGYAGGAAGVVRIGGRSPGTGSGTSRCAMRGVDGSGRGRRMRRCFWDDGRGDGGR